MTQLSDIYQPTFSIRSRFYRHFALVLKNSDACVMIESTQKMPVVFIGHGSPMNAIESHLTTQNWERLGQILRQHFAPRAILGISAHWATNGLFINNSPHLRQIYDMYGFPQALYDLTYEASSDEQIAQIIMHSLKDWEIRVDNTWGLDHGLWSVLCRIYPQPSHKSAHTLDSINIHTPPIIPLSINLNISLAQQLRLGEVLRFLRQKGVLILASGNIVHNLALLSWTAQNEGYEWARAFDVGIKHCILRRDFNAVVDYKTLKGSNKSFVTLEHFIPLLIALGASEAQDKIIVFNEAYNFGALAMTSYIFTESSAFEGVFLS
ncbi:dioxygenase [Helicobacter jaachi]|nr:class III extradiol ring-cleavage dioxygenase [Helicobacter jaachi]